MRRWLRAQWAAASERGRLERELDSWYEAVLPRGRTVVDWMLKQRGTVSLNDDDAAAVAVYVHWIVKAAESADSE